MSIPGSAELQLLASSASAQYTISRSLRFNSSDSGYCSRTFTSAGNRRTATLSFWIKRSSITADQTLFSAGSTGGEANEFEIYFGTGGSVLALRQKTSNTFYGETTAVFRDPSAWYHIVVAIDTTQSTAANRLKLYVNNIEQTLSGFPSQNADLGIGSATTWNICRRADAVQYVNGYLADFYYIDGQALTPSSFTEVSATTGQLIPKRYTGTFTGNSFWLQFADNSAATATTLGKDSSGLGNNWTPNNLSVTAGAGNDSLVDTPTSYGTDTGAGGEVRGNYCTLNPLKGGSPTNGNLEQQNSSPINFGTIGVSSGKWYFETVITTQTSGGIKIGVAQQSATGELGDTATAWAILGQSNVNNGQAINNGSLTSSYTTFAQGDVVNCAFDLDSGKIWWGKNGTWLNSGNPAAGTNAIYSNLSGTLFPAATANQGGYLTWNFGQRPFAYTAPSGFKALCDTNLPAPVVAKPNTVMDVALWTGNGGTQTVSYANSSFSPDFIWFKSRSIAMNNHVVDVVRGTDANGYLVMQTDATFGESVFDTSWHNTYGKLTSISNNSFTVVSGTSNGGFNTNNATYAGWAWDAGTTTSSNVAGSITSSVRASASSGFSVVTWTGTGGAGTVGHGLGVVPTFLIVKNRSRADDWLVYSSTQGANKFLQLNTTNAVQTATQPWNNTSPTSTVFSVFADTGTWTNKSGDNYVAYCFAPVVGYNSISSFVGNNSTDGTFVYTGHRVRWLLIKNATTAGTSWAVFDSARSANNVVGNVLLAQSSSSELSGTFVDFLSNGFKLRVSSDPSLNNSGDTYVYMAIAESPFQYARAR